MERLTEKHIECMNDFCHKTECELYSACPSLERYNRLAAYEDTGLEPEEVADILERYQGFRSAISDETGQPMVSWGRAGAICKADKEDRLVVLPCKVGSVVYAAETTPVIPLHIIAPAVYLDGAEGGDFETLDNFGKTVFLTREEAERALAGGADHA